MRLPYKYEDEKNIFVFQEIFNYLKECQEYTPNMNIACGILSSYLNTYSEFFFTPNCLFIQKESYNPSSFYNIVTEQYKNNIHAQIKFIFSWFGVGIEIIPIHSVINDEFEIVILVIKTDNEKEFQFKYYWSI